MCAKEIILRILLNVLVKMAIIFNDSVTISHEIIEATKTVLT